MDKTSLVILAFKKKTEATLQYNSNFAYIIYNIYCSLYRDPSENNPRKINLRDIKCHQNIDPERLYLRALNWHPRISFWESKDILKYYANLSCVFCAANP